MSNRLRFYQPHLFHKHTKSFFYGIKHALYNCIDEHGPITKNFVPSAMKRIFGVIKTHNMNFEINTGCSNNKWLEIYKQELRTKINHNTHTITLPWGDLKSIINKCIERGEYIQYFEELNK